MGDTVADRVAWLTLCVLLWWLCSTLSDLAAALREPRDFNVKLPKEINVVHRSATEENSHGE